MVATGSDVMNEVPRLPPLPSTIGSTARLSFPDGSSMEWRVVDEIRRHEDAEKILLVQRLRAIAKPDKEMFRFGYYIIGKKPKMKGKWVWGQFAPFITRGDFEALIVEARERQWIA